MHTVHPARLFLGLTNFVKILSAIKETLHSEKEVRNKQVFVTAHSAVSFIFLQALSISPRSISRHTCAFFAYLTQYLIIQTGFIPH